MAQPHKQKLVFLVDLPHRGIRKGDIRVGWREVPYGSWRVPEAPGFFFYVYSWEARLLSPLEHLATAAVGN